jgi:hypothetical protein
LYIIRILVSFVAWAIPPATLSSAKTLWVQGQYLLPLVTLEIKAQNGIRWAATGSQIGHEAPTNTVPAGLLAFPG